MIKGEKQKTAITKVYEAILQENLVDVCFLKGSIARGEDDEFSDVDFYCLVSNEKYDKFLERRIKYLKSYKSILHTEHVNFVCPQIICIYEDGLHFDLYTTTLNKLNYDDQIKVLYDPQDLLSSYQSNKLKLQPQDVANIVHELSFSILEFYQAFSRKDDVWALRLAHYIFGYYTNLIRYFIEPEKSKIPVKGFKKITNYENYKKYQDICKALTYSTSLLAVQMIVIEVDNLVMQLPIKVAEYLNIDFFLYCKNLIFKIKGV